MINSYLKIKYQKHYFIHFVLLLFYANAQGQKDKVNYNLIELFKEWRNFEIPPLKEGVLLFQKHI